MRIGKVVKRVEARAGVAAAEAKDAGCEFVISYTGDSVSVEAAEGQLVAMDVYQLDGARVRTIERITSDPTDLGWVYSSDARRRVGRVVELDPPYFSYCTFEGFESCHLGNEADVRGDGGSGCE